MNIVYIQYIQYLSTVYTVSTTIYSIYDALTMQSIVCVVWCVHAYAWHADEKRFTIHAHDILLLTQFIS